MSVLRVALIQLTIGVVGLVILLALPVAEDQVLYATAAFLAVLGASMIVLAPRWARAVNPKADPTTGQVVLWAFLLGGGALLLGAAFLALLELSL